MKTELIEREKYERVTNILYPFSGLDKIDSEIVANAAQRGKRVHDSCEGIVNGLGKFCDDDIEGYINSFMKWWEKGHKVMYVEKRFWDDEYKITGQVDFILDTPEGIAIVDLKTSYKPSKTWQAQGCAYAMLAKKAGLDVKKIYFIHLDKRGEEPKVYSYDVNDDFFLAILMVYRYFWGE